MRGLFYEIASTPAGFLAQAAFARGPSPRGHLVLFLFFSELVCLFILFSELNFDN
jgi:hypothetical protein